MKKVFILLVLAFVLNIYGVRADDKIQAYDSTMYFIDYENIQLYKGLEVQVKPYKINYRLDFYYVNDPDTYRNSGLGNRLKSKREKWGDYKGFFTDYDFRPMNMMNYVYAKIDGQAKSKYDSLAGRVFVIEEVIPAPQANRGGAQAREMFNGDYFLKLKEKGTDFVLYYLFDRGKKSLTGNLYIDDTDEDNFPLSLCAYEEKIEIDRMQVENRKKELLTKKYSLRDDEKEQKKAGIDGLITVSDEITSEAVMNKYDSLTNIVPIDYADRYIGQTFFCRLTDERRPSMNNFSRNYVEGTTIAEMRDNIVPYEDVEGKYWQVLDVFKSYDKKVYIKLFNKETSATVYYEYSPAVVEHETLFPFLVVGYYEKMKEMYVGKEYVINKYVANEYIYPKQIGEYRIKSDANTIWTSKDIIYEKYEYGTMDYILKIKLTDGKQETVVALSDFQKPIYGRKLFSVQEVTDLRKEFGNEIFENILNGFVEIGMTKEACLYAKGKPQSSSYVSGTENTLIEQWKYYGTYLHFRNGVLYNITDI